MKTNWPERRSARFEFLKSCWNRMWPDMCRHTWPESESVTAAPLLCMLTTCIKLRNLRINCSVLMSVIWFVLVLHTVMSNTCLFQCQLVLTNDFSYTDSMMYLRSNAVIPTVKYPLVISGAIQHFCRIWNRTAKNGVRDIWYIPSRNTQSWHACWKRNINQVLSDVK